MKTIQCVAFDCFGTLFDMTDVPRPEIAEYVRHVNKNDFSPYKFPESWWNLKPHPDVVDGIRYLQQSGYFCATLSNGGADLLGHISGACGIGWDFIVDLISYGVYKPHVDAYRTVEKMTGFKPSETLMVTANPTFGDIEGSALVGMESVLIRHGYPDTVLDLVDYIRVLEES